MTARRVRTLTSARAQDVRDAGEGWSMAVSLATKRWTLRELHSLPDDGNKYELVNGELFVTPAGARKPFRLDIAAFFRAALG